MFQFQSDPAEIAATLLGSSGAVRELRLETELAASVGARVLLAGEYGVGKRRIARIIHRRSVRCGGPFVTVRCADRQEHDLDTKLFGNRSGVGGALQRAQGGTLFMKDIDRLTPRIQGRLVNFLANGTRTTARIVGATTTPLADKLETGGFRSDLYYRLNTIFIPIPPLRDRPEDVEPLLEFFTVYYARRHGRSVPSLSLESRLNCRKYHWPGNLRQLQAAAGMFVVSAQQANAAEILETCLRTSPRTSTYISSVSPREQVQLASWQNRRRVPVA